MKTKEVKRPKPSDVAQQRTRKWLIEQGYLVATVEQWKRWPDPEQKECSQCGNQPMIAIRSDLFGVFDLLAIHPSKPEVMVVQTTTMSNHATRKMKVLASMETKPVLMANVRVLIQSWGQDVDNRWHSREEFITLRDFRQAFNYPNDVATLQEIQRKARRPDLPPGATLKFQPIKDEEIPF